MLHLLNLKIAVRPAYIDRHRRLAELGVIGAYRLLSQSQQQDALAAITVIALGLKIQVVRPDE